MPSEVGPGVMEAVAKARVPAVALAPVWAEQEKEVEQGPGLADPEVAVAAVGQGLELAPAQVTEQDQVTEQGRGREPARAVDPLRV